MLTDDDLRSRLTRIEDSFVERKPVRRQGEWLQAVVAFANSTPIGYPAVLFIGVDDGGQVADNVNPEEVMKSFSDVIASRVWPPVYTMPRALAHSGKLCVAVIVPGSPERPHFAGRAYVRLGTQTKEASEQQFSELIAQRTSKARELLAWAGRQITPTHLIRNSQGYSQQIPQQATYVESCNSHFVTLRSADRGVSDDEILISYPLNKIELGFDHKRERLTIYIYSDR